MPWTAEASTQKSDQERREPRFWPSFVSFFASRPRLDLPLKQCSLALESEREVSLFSHTQEGGNSSVLSYVLRRPSGGGGPEDTEPEPNSSLRLCTCSVL